MRKAFPRTGTDWKTLEAEMAGMSDGDIDWRHGRAPLYVFHGSDSAHEVGKQAFMNFFSENALGGRRAFFGLKRMEDEVVEIRGSIYTRFRMTDTRMPLSDVVLLAPTEPSMIWGPGRNFADHLNFAAAHTGLGGPTAPEHPEP